MIESQSEVHIVPTELERGDGFLDLAALAAAGMGVWYGLLVGIPLWPMLPLVVLIAAWSLTGEAAGDITAVPFVGPLAAGLRSKLGLRRSHEWVLAWWHYFRVRQWPDLCAWVGVTRVRCVARFHASSY